MDKLKGRVALITGASMGLGRATALTYAAEGARLGLCARHPEPLARVAAAIRALGAEVLATPADTGVEADRERLLAVTEDRFGRIDVLVNNASTLGPLPLPQLTDLDLGDLQEVLRVNLEGPFQLAQGVLAGMIARGSCVIINVSSDAALEAYPGWGAYSAAKAALDALTRVWAEELKGTGVEVVSFDPGDMDTAMHRAALPDDDPGALARPEQVAERLVDLARGRAGAVRVTE
ncbi:MAG TPA: SDR family oxidoreductase [Candidatus Dormibacteraeota bacterium]|jgi:NAD(P)-dependent dehydrogenase (short-subunit alcohol dehydrogenase family)|nr:SDR family oxidoreductase [Candidatus Dormibacteraeota bacterium]